MRHENSGRHKNSAHNQAESTLAAAGRSDSCDARDDEEERPQEIVDAGTGIQIGQTPRCNSTVTLRCLNTLDTARGGA